MAENQESYPDRIAEFYIDKTIFVTGGTGFVGKVLIEKLLRSCTGLRRIYILVRNKKGKNPNERLKEIFAGPLYDKLRREMGNDAFNKVTPLIGDCELSDLGMSEDNKAIVINETEIIYHCAATIRFDEAIKKAVLLNVRGTKLMLGLAKECKKLMVFCHLSTAYCHLHEKVLYEKAYPPPANPHLVIKSMELLSDEAATSITDKILGDIPNTYAFTKALGESLVNDEMDSLPVIIIRPSIVLPIWREPIPGWTDNINGPTGLLIGAGKGVIRTMYCDGDGYGDLIPVDVCINGMLAAVFDYVLHKERRIYNFTSSAEYKVTWEEVIEIGRDIINTKMPLNGVVWYPGGSMKKSRWLHNLCYFFFHLVPAVLVDGLLILLGYKPILMRVQKRISKGFEVFEYYANNQWEFNNDESMRAREFLNPKEKEIYKVDGSGVNYYEYFTDCIHAARFYILKEPDETLPAARRHMMVMWCVDKICKTLVLFSVLYFLVTHLLMPILGYSL